MFKKLYFKENDSLSYGKICFIHYKFNTTYRENGCSIVNYGLENGFKIHVDIIAEKYCRQFRLIT